MSAMDELWGHSTRIIAIVGENNSSFSFDSTGFRPKENLILQIWSCTVDSETSETLDSLCFNSGTHIKVR